MRIIFCVLISFLFHVLTINAQAFNSADCRTAVPICADSPIMSFANGGGAIVDFDPEIVLQSGCLEKGSNDSANIEHNSAWYVFRADKGGQIGFDIEAQTVHENSAPSAEWDFAVFGPNVDCGAISSGVAQPIRCNFKVNDTNFTGLGINPISGQVGAPSVSDSDNTYDEWLEVQPGEIYYIFINNYNTNFDGDPEPFKMTFTGSAVASDKNAALDCLFRDEFLGLDVSACVGGPDVLLTSLNSSAGSDIESVRWFVDYEDDGVVDETLTGSGPFGAELSIASPKSGRYFAEITTVSGSPATLSDEGGILVTFYSDPVLDRIDILNTNLSANPNQNDIEILVAGDSDYEYAINNGDFQDEAIFYDVAPGLNTIIVNDKNGCGITNSIEFLVVAYPKFFTPNGDGVHETWHILGIETLKNPTVKIFDRYGKLIAQLNTNSGWDGNFKGQPMPSSDYWFRLEYEEQKNSILVAQIRQSHFTLKR